MGCFKQLVDSSFLSNALRELKNAQRRVDTSSILAEPPTLYADKTQRRYLYDEYLYEYYHLYEMMDVAYEDPENLFYIQEDCIIFLFSRKKALVDEALTFTHNIHGDIPLCRTKHIISGKTFFTALIDTRLTFTPASPN